MSGPTFLKSPSPRSRGNRRYWADHGCRTPRVPDLMILAISTCDHHSVPGSPLIKDHVPADTEPSWEPHGPKARRLTICNSSPRAPRRLSTAVVVHDLWQQVHVRMSIAYHLPPINQEDLVHCMLRWVSSRLKHRCSTHQIVTSKISSFVHLMNRRHRKETCTFFHAVHICSIQMVFH